jgi:MoaA/NifB/PqqE/SkfB family radical SAM enzyme
MSIVSDLFAGEIGVSVKTAVSVLMSYPASAAALAKIAKRLKNAERRRAGFAGKGVSVPPLMIISTTEECNLSCKGCYACEQGRKTGEALPAARVSEVLEEASELGVSIVMLAGGEPLLSQNWLDAMSKHSELLGLVFTNGTLLDENRFEWFAEFRHIIPVLSIEGDAERTDARRGAGIHAKVNEAMEAMRSLGIPFGAAITVTRQNMGDVMSDDFTCEYLRKGCRLFIYVEYVPVEPGTEPLVLSKEDKKRLGDFTDQSALKHAALCRAFPGDEEPHGGCLAAGRGFVHISAAGGVEPCPFAPFSDVNLKNTTLYDALNSALLAKVRENHHLLVEGDGGCALWRNRDLLTGLVQE